MDHPLRPKQPIEASCLVRSQFGERGEAIHRGRFPEDRAYAGILGLPYDLIGQRLCNQRVMQVWMPGPDGHDAVKFILP